MQGLEQADQAWIEGSRQPQTKVLFSTSCCCHVATPEHISFISVSPASAACS